MVLHVKTWSMATHAPVWLVPKGTDVNMVSNAFNLESSMLLMKISVVKVVVVFVVYAVLLLLMMMMMLLLMRLLMIMMANTMTVIMLRKENILINII